MGVTGMQVLGASLAFVGLVGVIVCTASNEWRITSRAKSLMTASWVSHGLWKQCTANAMGSMQCKPNFTMLDLDVYIRACQGLMVSSVVIGGLAALCTLFGMKCTHVGSLTAKSKAHMSIFSGTAYMLSGAAAVTAVSYYAHAVTIDFYDPYLIGAKYEYGSGLYVGWAGSCLVLLGGGLLLCAACRQQRESSTAQPYHTTPRVFQTCGDGRAGLRVVEGPPPPPPGRSARGTRAAGRSAGISGVPGSDRSSVSSSGVRGLHHPKSAYV
ncbi:claudin-7-like [Petromyzon marinus]|uniref:claudin-7-like n=1 Tax=Petromyzon marinus TaxID=7757 RepID=UPI003F728F34